MRNGLIVLLLFITSTAFAADRNEKIRLLLDAQGLSESLQNNQAWFYGFRKKQIEEGSEIFLKKANLNPSAEFKSKLEDAKSDLYKATELPWSIQDKISDWVKYYDENFSDEEINQMLAFYTRPVAKKDSIYSRRKKEELRDHYLELYNPILQDGMTRYFARLTQLIKECHCTNKP